MSDQPVPNARHSSADIYQLLGSIKEEKATQLFNLTHQKAEQAAAPAPINRLNPELQPYLPAVLWRDLNKENPRRGLFYNALDRMQSLLYVISTYLPANLVQEKLQNPEADAANGKMLQGCLLFSDVSGFTALSERLATLGPQGAEHLTSVINRYFSTMIDILSWSDGTLLKFAGDATLVYFPEQAEGAHVQRAARAALRMMRAMQEFSNLPTPLGPVRIAMKVGLSAGSFLAASIGSNQRMEYALIGSTVTQTLQAEGCTKPGDIVANQIAANWLTPAYPMTEVKPGFYLLNADQEQKLDEYEISQTQKRRSQGSAIEWDTQTDEIKTKINEKLIQIKALMPYLASELLERIVTHADARQVQSEYRPTTIMFCNFTGPEALLETWGELGAQRVTKILSEYFNAIHEVIHHFGGIISRIDPYSQGTKLLALFGAPIAHEDDPQRAISAALEMNNALLKLNQTWAQTLSRHLPRGSHKNLIEHRIGITLGDTFAGQAGSPTRREYTVMGDVVNLAARLMSAAHTEQILISEPVFQAANAHYITRKLPSIRVKGKKNLIAIWQVDGPREDTLLNRIQNRTPLMGRAPELAQGWRALQRAQSGISSVLTLNGQAGIGKSHLADALLNQALQNGWQVYAFQCRSYLMREPYASWKGMLRSLAAITSIDHPLIQKEKLERLRLPRESYLILKELMGLGNDTPAIESGDSEEDLAKLVLQKKLSRRSSNFNILLQWKEKDGNAQKEPNLRIDKETAQRWQAALSGALHAIAAQKPLAIFFEDAQWMDAESKAYLEILEKEPIAQPLLFLIALRTQKTERKEFGETIKLKPFTKMETRSMVAEILTAGLVDIIHEQSNGSPLFVEEISRWIKNTHSIDETRLKEILQTSDILQKLALSRLESLPEGQREVARLASIIGSEFYLSEIKALIQATLEPATLHEYLNDLSNAHLITLSEYGMDRRYAFVQPIFREILYTSLPFERRRDLHSRMAKHLQQPETHQRSDKVESFLKAESQTPPTQVTEKLAYHYEMSEQWLAAAKHLMNTASIKNESLYNRALALLEQYSPEKTTPDIQLQKTMAYMGLGNIALQRTDLAASVAAHHAALATLPAEAEFFDLAANLTARLALLLPSQKNVELAEKQLAKMLKQRPTDWKLLGISAWLTWRAKNDATAAIETCRANLPQPETQTSLRLRALMDDLSGNWAAAAEAYQLLGEFHAAALAWVQWGDWFAQQKNSTEASKQYDLAAGVWQGMDFCGMALIHYRRAELAWQAHHDQAALTLLQEALTLLEKSAPSLQAEPRSSIQKALTRIYKKQYGDWKYWRWQPFDDLARIQLYLPLLQEIK